VKVRAAAAAFLFAAGPAALAESRVAEVAAWLTGTFEAKDPTGDGVSTASRRTVRSCACAPPTPGIL
jgi:hypothetical protein